MYVWLNGITIFGTAHGRFVSRDALSRDCTEEDGPQASRHGRTQQRDKNRRVFGENFKEIPPTTTLAPGQKSMPFRWQTDEQRPR